jgi:serine/threonine protein kinase
LGVTLYYALAGRLPYRDDSPLATAVLHVTQPVPNILAVKPDLLPTWEEIIGKAMAKNPAERYATAGDLARDVREAASGRWYLRKLVDNV